MRRNRSRYLTFAAALALFALNAWICRELFRTPYVDQMQSIDAAFISIARWAAQHFGELSWFPLWYAGIPYQNSYPPLLHLAVAALARLFAMDPGLAYHIVAGVIYAAGPVTLFLLARRLSGSLAYSWWAGIIYSLISTSAFIIPEIRGELGSLWRARRFQTLVYYGEGPHNFGLTLLPLAILALDVAVQTRRRWAIVLAALTFAATVLTNWLAAVALAAAVLGYWLADRRAAGLILGISGLAYAFAAPWIPPSTIQVIQFNAKTIGGDFTNVYRTLPLYGSLLAAALGAVWLLVRRCERTVIFAAVFTLLMGALAIPGYYGISVMPQPHRYHLELELGLALLIPFLVRPLISRIPFRTQIAVGVALALLAIYPAKQYRRFARFLARPIDIAQTVEYQAAKWMESNLAGGRVLAAGSVSFWMNAFTDIPQIGGGFDQGTINFMTRVLNYVVYSDDGVKGDALANTDLWLKAFGVDAVHTGGPQSREFYKPFRHPEKFAGRYTLLWRNGDDYIYRVPRRSASLAHVVDVADLASRTPINGIDTEPLIPYVAALDNPANPILNFRWIRNDRLRISGEVPAGKLVSVQMTYHKGWHTSRGTIARDGLGLMAVATGCSGSCEFEMWYDGGTEMLVARWVCWIALAASASWIAWGLLRG